MKTKKYYWYFVTYGSNKGQFNHFLAYKKTFAEVKTLLARHLNNPWYKDKYFKVRVIEFPIERLMGEPYSHTQVTTTHNIV